MIDKKLITLALCPRVVENVFTTCDGIVCECKSIILEKKECFLRLEHLENKMVVFLEKHNIVDNECESSEIVTNYFTDSEIKEFEELYEIGCK